MNLLARDAEKNAGDFDALVRGECADPFNVLGPRRVGKQRVVRAFLPGAAAVELVDGHGQSLASMERVHADGLFSAILPPLIRHYRFRFATPDGGRLDCEDPYRFASALTGEADRPEAGVLGSHRARYQGIDGTRFAVWAPNARRVSVVGDWNGWDGRVHVMHRHSASGIWELFLPQVGEGALYKYEIKDSEGRLLPLKADPHARRFEAPPGTASIVFESRYDWGDEDWMRARPDQSGLDRPVSIYEVHPGSWRRKGESGCTPFSYRELALELVAYVTDMGFTHIEFLPVTEHPFDGSWGYQPIGMYAATSRFGSPDDFRFLVDCCHRAGVGVIVDWVGAHFPRDDHGLRRFDGTALYEHEDPRRAEHLDWGTLIFDFGRAEVVDYLVGSARFWVEDMHVDGLRVDAVASMLYLDYSRKGADWLPNEHGGNENHEAVAFLKRMNEIIHASGATTFAEESTTWPGVSRPVYAGGLGFTYKWNLGWMHDTLAYMGEDPLYRKHHHDKMTFGLVYAFEENFVLPLSHDEVVHGKRSLIGRMPGDDWQRFASYRAYLAFQYCHPGKKLLFMGGEFGQLREWSHERSLDWHLLDQPLHAGVQKLVRDLNRAYRQTPALYEVDFEQRGFDWLIADDRDQSVFAWLRRDQAGRPVVCIANLTPVVRHDYAIDVPLATGWREVINTDSAAYGGSGVATAGAVDSVKRGASGAQIRLTLPPLALILLVPQSS